MKPEHMIMNYVMTNKLETKYVTALNRVLKHYGKDALEYVIQHHTAIERLEDVITEYNKMYNAYQLGTNNTYGINEEQDMVIKSTVKDQDWDYEKRQYINEFFVYDKEADKLVKEALKRKQRKYQPTFFELYYGHEKVRTLRYGNISAHKLIVIDQVRDYLISLGKEATFKKVLNLSKEDFHKVVLHMTQHGRKLYVPQTTEDYVRAYKAKRESVGAIKCVKPQAPAKPVSNYIAKEVVGISIEKYNEITKLNSKYDIEYFKGMFEPIEKAAPGRIEGSTLDYTIYNKDYTREVVLYGPALPTWVEVLPQPKVWGIQLKLENIEYYETIYALRHE